MRAESAAGAGDRVPAVARHEGGLGHHLHPGPRGGEGHLQSAGRRDREAEAGAGRGRRCAGPAVGRGARGPAVRGQQREGRGRHRLVRPAGAADAAGGDCGRRRPAAGRGPTGAGQTASRQWGADGDRDDGEVTLKEGVSQDRTVSVHDPEMRHGHKSSHRRFDGHKAAVVVDTASQLITAVDVLPGHAWDSLGALQLVAQSEVSAGVPVARVPGRPQRTHFPKEDFVIDLAEDTCTCPAGQVTRHQVPMATRTDRTGRTYKTTGVRFAGAVCDVCPARPRCVAARPGTGRTVRLHPQEGLLQQARALQHSPEFAQYRQLRVTAEHRLARLMQLGMRQARCLGRAKTKCQLYLAATVANLTLVTRHMGRAGDPHDDHPAAPAAANMGGDHGRRRHPLLPCLRAWLQASTLPLSLCPNRAFRPTFYGCVRGMAMWCCCSREVQRCEWDGSAA